MNENNARPKFSHLLWGVGGIATGAYLASSSKRKSLLSRSEIDYPDDVNEVKQEIASLLEKWQPEEFDSESDYTDDLFDFLTENSEWEIELYPDSPEGKPDILIGDLLALELKVNPGKSERDRLIGQCAGYSRQWVTWAIIIDSPESKVGRLVDLLKDKGLDHIEVWSF
jgi:hypothetical protein